MEDASAANGPPVPPSPPAEPAGERPDVERKAMDVVHDCAERVKMERALRAERDRSALLLQGLSDLGEAVVAGSGERLSYVNDAFCRLSGYTREELLAMPSVTALVMPDERSLSELRLRQLEEGAAFTLFEGGIRHKDGHMVPLEISARSYETDGQQQFVAVMRDLTERVQSAARLQASLAEKEVLLKEVHHRVKNNLQVIISLLRLQSQQLADPQAREQFRDTQNRVRAMALVHEQLYGTADLAHISFTAYVRNLANSVLRSYTTQAGRVTLALLIPDDLALTLDIAAPLGLVLAELISNSIKYAFPDGREGTITIEAHADGHTLTLSFADNGVGFPATLDLAGLTSLGLQLVQRLVAQLGGRLELGLRGGTMITLTIPLAGKEES